MLQGRSSLGFKIWAGSTSPWEFIKPRSGTSFPLKFTTNGSAVLLCIAVLKETRQYTVFLQILRKTAVINCRETATNAAHQRKILSQVCFTWFCFPEFRHRAGHADYCSKRVKRSRSGSNSSSSDDDDRSRRRGRSRSSSYKNGRRRRISRTISLDTGNRQQSKECRHWSNTSNRVRNESRDNAYDRRKKTPEVAVVEVDVDDLEAQLEKFKRDKKAQALANNKDVFKRTFLWLGGMAFSTYFR